MQSAVFSSIGDKVCTVPSLYCATCVCTQGFDCMLRVYIHATSQVLSQFIELCGLLLSSMYMRVCVCVNWKGYCLSFIACNWYRPCYLWHHMFTKEPQNLDFLQAGFVHGSMGKYFKSFILWRLHCPIVINFGYEGKGHISQLVQLSF